MHSGASAVKYLTKISFFLFMFSSAIKVAFAPLYLEMGRVIVKVTVPQDGRSNGKGNSVRTAVTVMSLAWRVIMESTCDSQLV